MSFTGTLDKCNACDKTVYVVDMLSIEGMPYHKSCFRCTHCKGTLVTRTPSKISSIFCGTQDKCAACDKTVYPLEKVGLAFAYLKRYKWKVNASIKHVSRWLYAYSFLIRLPVVQYLVLSVRKRSVGTFKC